ncbi:MAG: putative ABC transporter permease [Candidatus Ruminococcus intestinipullorum]|nr:putative ABC transporter permease [Candidatus Ruminococcus intestinipullorum]
MWGRIILGNEFYHILLWFLTYSILGWIVESIYMSFCNGRLTNRGFARGPFCPIYGVGALTVYFVLFPYRKNKIILFLLGAVLATVLEWLTAMVMLRIFGTVWWDYHEKPFNYKGILCLESTVAWGFYTLFLFGILHTTVEKFVNVIPRNIGKVLGTFILILAILDFTSTFLKERHREEDIEE